MRPRWIRSRRRLSRRWPRWRKVARRFRAATPSTASLSSPRCHDASRRRTRPVPPTPSRVKVRVATHVLLSWTRWPIWPRAERARRHGSDGMEGQRARGKVTRGEVGGFTRAVVVFPVPRLRFSFLQMTTGYRTKARLTGRVARTRSMCAVPTAWCVLVRERGNTRGQPREEQRAPRRSARDERACACRLKACRRSCRSPAPPGPCPCGCASG